jgi:hypothetical protein
MNKKLKKKIFLKGLKLSIILFILLISTTTPDGQTGALRGGFTITGDKPIIDVAPPAPAPLPPVVDVAPPPPITGLTATDAHDGKIDLSWIPSKAIDFAYYLIYVSKAEIADVTGLFPVAKVTDIAVHAYQVTGLIDGTRYWFAVTTVDLAGNEDTKVTSVSATPTKTPIIDVTPPAPLPPVVDVEPPAPLSPVVDVAPPAPLSPVVDVTPPAPITERFWGQITKWWDDLPLWLKIVIGIAGGFLIILAPFALIKLGIIALIVKLVKLGALIAKKLFLLLKKLLRRLIEELLEEITSAAQWLWNGLKELKNTIQNALGRHARQVRERCVRIAEWKCDEWEKTCDEWVKRRGGCERFRQERQCINWQCENMSWLRRLACRAGRAIGNAVCDVYEWVTTNICEAYQWVATNLCKAGRWVYTGVCKVGRFVITTICKAYVDAVNWVAGN